jgi:hypothetical protein
VQAISARSNKSLIEYAEKEELDVKPTWFIYPNFIEPIHVMELDELTEETFMLVCIKDKKRVHIWRGFDFTEDDLVKGA